MTLRWSSLDDDVLDHGTDEVGGAGAGTVTDGSAGRRPAGAVARRRAAGAGSARGVGWLQRAMRLVVVVGLLVCGGVAVPLPPAAVVEAANTVAFAAKFTANANGSILTIGNSLLTCPASAASCAAARAGLAADNNSFNMVNVDADGVAGTANSSSSALNLPAGASVLWAGLYWGARLQAGTGGTAGNAGAINSMSLWAPRTAGYQTITASTAPHDQFGPNRQLQRLPALR